LVILSCKSTLPKKIEIETELEKEFRRDGEGSPEVRTEIARNKEGPQKRIETVPEKG
jgi:hypothetical protein